MGLFGPVPARRNGPYGIEHVVVEPSSSARPRWKDRKTDTKSMAAISVDQVVTAVESALDRSNVA